jgi:hypothetical protein
MEGGLHKSNNWNADILVRPDVVRSAGADGKCRQECRRSETPAERHLNMPILTELDDVCGRNPPKTPPSSFSFIE